MLWPLDTALQQAQYGLLKESEVAAAGAVTTGMKQFKESESELLGAKHTAADFFTHGDKGMLLLGVLLKAADISNPSRPREIANKWNRLCYDEFFAEGAANRSAGREVLPLHDPVNDTPIAIAKASVGFIDFA